MARKVWQSTILLTLLETILITASSAPSPSPAAAASTAGPPIKIGVITELTGASASAGQGAKNGIGLTLKDINDKGGVLGRKIEILFEDDASTQSGAVNAFNKLVLEDKVVTVIGPLYSTLCLAVKPVAEKAGVPFIAMGLNDKIGTEGNPKWTFQGRTPDSLTPYLAVDFLLGKLGKKKPAIIFVDDDYGVDGKNTLLKAFEEKKVQIVTTQAVHGGDKDFTAQILNIKKNGADGIIAWVHVDEAGLILRQLKEQGIDISKVPFVGNSSFLGAGVLDVAGDAAIGQYVMAGAAPPLQNPEWSKRFQTAYNYEPDFLAGEPADILVTLVRGIQLAGSTEPEAIRKGLLSMKDYKALFQTHGFGRAQRPQQGMFSASIIQVVAGKKQVMISEVTR